MRDWLLKPVEPSDPASFLDGVITLISDKAASSFVTLRETIIRFAPFAANCFATLLPMPSEAPVKRMVC